MSDVVIVGAKRTAIGSFLGQFTGVPTPTLGAAAITGALEQAGVAAGPGRRSDHGLRAAGRPRPGAGAPGLARAPACPTSAGCTTINKVCGSGMKAIMLGHDLIKAGSANVVVAGGMESMTNAPHLLNNSRTGIRYGSAELLDHMAWDGLTNPYDGKAMGVFGDMRLRQVRLRPRGAGRVLRRERASARRPRMASRRVQGRNRSGHGQGPQGRRRGRHRRGAGQDRPRQDPDPARRLRQGRRADRGLVLEDFRRRRRHGADVAPRKPAKRGLKPLARIVAHATHAQAPEWFTTAPVKAISNVLEKAGWTVADVDLFEVNEAFAVRGDGADEGPRHPPRQAERQRRRLRAGPSDRRQRRPPGGDPDPCAASTRRQARRRFAVHRRRRSHRDRHRIAVKTVNERYLQKKLGQPLDSRHRLVIMLSARTCALPNYNDEET